MTNAIDTRRIAIADFIAAHVEPLVSDEIAAAMNIGPTTVRTDLKALVDEDFISMRDETDEERFIRYNKIARGTNSKLYSSRKTVPPRTQRRVVAEYIAEAAEKYERTSIAKVDRRIAGVFRINSPRWRFTVQKLSRMSKVNPTTVRDRLKKFEEELGYIERTGEFDAGKVVFRVIDKDGIMASLTSAQQPELPFVAPKTPNVPVPEKNLEVPAPPTAATPNTYADRVAAVRADAEQKADQLPALTRELHELESRVADVRARLDEATEAAAYLVSIS